MLASVDNKEEIGPGVIVVGRGGVLDDSFSSVLHIWALVVLDILPEHLTDVFFGPKRGAVDGGVVLVDLA